MRLRSIRVSSQLYRHCEHLLEQDQWFRRAWEQWSRGRREAFLQTAAMLDDRARSPTLDRDYLAAHDRARRTFLVVPERGIQESKVNLADWVAFAGNAEEKREVYSAARAYFEHVLFDSTGSARPIALYGGIKDISGLLHVPMDVKPGASAYSRNVGDLWDVVRFRAVVPNPLYLIALTLRMCERHIDDLVKCRNYYVHPRPADTARPHPYRAIHLQVPVLDRMVELQLMTAAYEVVSYFDHALMFKRRISFIDEAHQIWLSRICMAALVVDMESDRYHSRTLSGVLNDLLEPRLARLRRLLPRRRTPHHE